MTIPPPPGARYPNLDDDLTIYARVKEWEIFAPDWSYLGDFPALSLASLCALSVGLRPQLACPSWVFNVALPHFDGSKRDELADPIQPDERAECDRRAALLREFLRRVHIAPANLAPLGSLPIATGDADAERTLVRVADFAAWAEGREWTLPPEFPHASRARAFWSQNPEQTAAAPSGSAGETPEPTTPKDAPEQTDTTFFVRGISSVTALNLNGYNRYQQDLANRRAKGRYTIEEAAMFIGDTTGERADELLRKLMDAARSGALPVYEPGKQGRYLYGEGFASRVRHFYEEARWCDLNKWLAENEPLIAFSFPDTQALTPGPDEAREQTGAAPSGAQDDDQQGELLTEPQQKAGEPAGIPKKEVLSVDWPLFGRFKQASLISALSDVPNWLKRARTAPGSPGKESALWNPARLADCLLAQGHANEKALRLFLGRHFAEWLPEWEKLQEYR